MARMEDRMDAYRILVERHVVRRPLGNVGVDGRIILKLVFKKCEGGGMNWIDLIWDRDRWRALVSTVMNIRGR